MEKILTFDCYGTLLDTGALYRYIAGLAQENGLPGDRARDIFTHYEDRLMYGEDFIPYEQLLLLALEYCDMELNSNVFAPQWPRILELHKEFRPYGDVISTLNELKARQYTLILMSNSAHEIMDHHMARLEHLFDGCVLAEDTRCYKPNLEFFRYTSRKYDLSSGVHCHIAKGYWWDIVPCSKLGWNKIWVNRDQITGSRRHLPYREVRTLDELKQLL